MDGATTDAALRPPRKRRLAALAVTTLIAVSILTTFWWVAADPSAARFLGAGDAWEQAGPGLFFMDHGLHDGELPLWNPLYFCGQPHAANPQAFLFYPPNALRSLLTQAPTPKRTHVGIALMLFVHLVFAGATMYLLSRHHGISVPGSLLAAFAYVLSAPAVLRAVGHWYFDTTAAWLPLLILLLRMGLTAPSRRREAVAGIAAGLVYGIAILGGVPSLIVLMGFTIAAYVVCYRLAALIPAHEKDETKADKSHKGGRRKGNTEPAGTRAEARGQGRAGRWSVQVMLGDIGLLAAIVVVAILVAAPMLLPAKEFAAHSARAQGTVVLAGREATGPDWSLPQLLAVYSGDASYEGVKAAGAIMLLFALASLTARRRRRDIAVYGLLFLALLDASLPRSILVGPLLSLVAPFKMAEPGRAMLIACLPLGLLAGMGLDATLSPSGARSKTVRTVVLALFGGTVLLALASRAYNHPFLAVSKWALILPSLACMVAIAGVWLPRPHVWGTAVVLMCFGETLAWNKVLLPHLFNAETQYPGEMSALEKPKTFWSNNQRGSVADPNINVYDLAPAINGYDPLHIEEVREVICAVRHEGMYFRKIRDWEPFSGNQRGGLFLKRSLWLARQYVEGPLPPKHAIYPAATTVFLPVPSEVPVAKVARGGIEGRGVSDDAQRTDIIAMDAPPVTLKAEPGKRNQASTEVGTIHLPPYHSVLAFAVTNDCAADLELALTDLEQAHSVQRITFYLPNDGTTKRFEVALSDFTEMNVGLRAEAEEKTGTIQVAEMYALSDRQDEDELIHIVKRTPNTVEVEVDELPGYRILTLVDAAYPGWRATVDEKPTPLLRANDVFKAVVLPPGRHHVRFAFTSWRVYAGLAVSSLTCALLCAVGIAHGLTSRRRE